MNGPFQSLPADKPARIIGLCVEPSGIRATLVTVAAPKEGEKRPKVRMQSEAQFELGEALQEAALRFRRGEAVRPSDLADVSVTVGEAMADAVKSLAEKGRLSLAEVDLIGVGGLALPEGSQSPLGVELGEPAFLAERTGIPVVSGFAARDVAAGGQGGPLHALPDWALFAKEGTRTAVQRLGPTGSVTILPPSDDPSEIVAFDTGPGTLVIDTVVRHLTGGAQGSDTDGSLALQGNPDEAVVDELLARPFFEMVPPKRGLGFDESYATEMVQLCQARGLSLHDSVATATLLVARAVTDQYRRFVPDDLAEVVVGGPGSDNPALVGMLLGSLYPMSVVRYPDKGWSDSAPQAATYAVLAWYTWRGEAANLPSVSGARGPRILGMFTPGAARQA